MQELLNQKNILIIVMILLVTYVLLGKKKTTEHFSTKVRVNPNDGCWAVANRGCPGYGNEWQQIVCDSANVCNNLQVGQMIPVVCPNTGDTCSPSPKKESSCQVIKNMEQGSDDTHIKKLCNLPDGAWKTGAKVCVTPTTLKPDTDYWNFSDRGYKCTPMSGSNCPSNSVQCSNAPTPQPSPKPTPPKPTPAASCQSQQATVIPPTEKSEYSQNCIWSSVTNNQLQASGSTSLHLSNPLRPVSISINKQKPTGILQYPPKRSPPKNVLLGYGCDSAQGVTCNRVPVKSVLENGINVIPMICNLDIVEPTDLLVFVPGEKTYKICYGNQTYSNGKCTSHSMSIAQGVGHPNCLRTLRLLSKPENGMYGTYDGFYDGSRTCNSNILNVKYNQFGEVNLNNTEKSTHKDVPFAQWQTMYNSVNTYYNPDTGYKTQAILSKTSKTDDAKYDWSCVQIPYKKYWDGGVKQGNPNYNFERQLSQSTGSGAPPSYGVSGAWQTNLPYSKSDLQILHDNGVTLLICLGAWNVTFPNENTKCVYDWFDSTNIKDGLDPFDQFVVYFEAIRDQLGGTIDGIDFDWEGYCPSYCMSDNCVCSDVGRNGTTCSGKQTLNNNYNTPGGTIFADGYTHRVMLGITRAMHKRGYVVTGVPMSTQMYVPEDLNNQQLDSMTGEQVFTSVMNSSSNEFLKYTLDYSLYDGIMLQWYSGSAFGPPTNDNDLKKECYGSQSVQNKPFDTFMQQGWMHPSERSKRNRIFNLGSYSNVGTDKAGLFDTEDVAVGIEHFTEYANSNQVTSNQDLVTKYNKNDRCYTHCPRTRDCPDHFYPNSTPNEHQANSLKRLVTVVEKYLTYVLGSYAKNQSSKYDKLNKTLSAYNLSGYDQEYALKQTQLVVGMETTHSKYNWGPIYAWDVQLADTYTSAKNPGIKQLLNLVGKNDQGIYNIGGIGTWALCGMATKCVDNTDSCLQTNTYIETTQNIAKAFDTISSSANASPIDNHIDYKQGWCGLPRVYCPDKKCVQAIKTDPATGKKIKTWVDPWSKNPNAYGVPCRTDYNCPVNPDGTLTSCLSAMSGCNLTQSVDQKLWNPTVPPSSAGLSYEDWLPYGQDGINMCTTGPTAATSYLMNDNLNSIKEFQKQSNPPEQQKMQATPYHYRHMYKNRFSVEGCDGSGNCGKNYESIDKAFVNYKDNDLDCLAYPNSCADNSGNGKTPLPKTNGCGISGGGSSCSPSTKGTGTTRCGLNWSDANTNCHCDCSGQDSTCKYLGHKARCYGQLNMAPCKK